MSGVGSRRAKEVLAPRRVIVGPPVWCYAAHGAGRAGLGRAAQCAFGGQHTSRSVPGFAINSRALFHIAREACGRAPAAPAQSIVAIAFSAIALESFVNEIVERLDFRTDPHDAAEVTTLRAMAAACDLSSRSASLSTKIQVIHAALTGRALDRGQQPYQDFDLLIMVRNAIVHDRPERIESNDDGGRAGLPLSVVRRLAARGIVDLPDESIIVYPAWNSLTDARVANWAYDTALTMARTLAEAFPARGWGSSLLIGFDSLPRAESNPTGAAERGAAAEL